MATLTYKGLTGIRDDVTVDLATATLDELITAIAADEGLPTDYYNISVYDNPSINSITLGDSSTTCADAGIVDGDLILCTPEQSGSRERRQIQKLEIAQLKRRGTPGDDSSVTVGYYRQNNTYNLTQLPTKYSGNTIVDNLNPTGLLSSRPWNTAQAPEFFSGLAVWYDTAKASTMNSGTYSNGTMITTFTNRATGVNPTSLSSDGPVVLTGAGDTLNGYPILRFVSSTGTSDGFRLTTNSFDNATGWTMVMLAKPSVTPGKNPSFFRIMDLGTFTDRAVVRYVSQSQFVLYAPTGTASVASNVDPDGTWKIITCRYDSTAAAASRFTFRWGKEAKTVTNGGTPPSGTIPATAGYIDLMGAWDSDFAEQVAYNRALSDAEIIALEDYLSTKWGV